MAWKRFWNRLLGRRTPPQPAPADDELLAPLRRLAQDQGRSLDEVTYDLLASSLVRQVPVSRSPRCWDLFTAREQDVAALIYAGYSYSQIAVLLGLALSTVSSHAQRMMRKCNVHGRAGLRTVLYQEGADRRIQRRLEELISPPPDPGVRE